MKALSLLTVLSAMPFVFCTDVHSQAVLDTTQSPTRAGHVIVRSTENTIDPVFSKTFSLLSGIFKVLGSSLKTGQAAGSPEEHLPLYCPKQCQCNSTLDTWLYGLKTSKSHGVDIDCSLTSETFDLENELLATMRSINASANVTIANRGIRVRCQDGGSIRWNGDIFLNDTLIDRFEVHRCSIVGNDTVRFAGWRSLKYLILNQIPNFNLRNFSFEGLSSLQNLTLSGNRISALSHTCSLRYHELPALKYLNLANNSLYSLPCDVIRHMPRLTDILLSHNRFTLIHTCWLEANLIRLDMENNLVSSLEALEIFRGRLMNLNLARNHVTELPRIATSVSVLNISHNKLTNIRKEHLQSARSSGNFFTDFLTKSSRFFALDFSHNNISYIEPGAFDGVSMITKFLDFSDNCLTRFEREHSPSGTLSGIKLDLRNNKLTYPPFYESDFKAPSEVVMFASGNPYVCHCDSVEKMQRLPRMVGDLYRKAGKMGDFDLDFRDGLDFLSHSKFQRYGLSNKPLGTTVYDIDFFRCGSPSLVQDKLVRDLNVTEECDIVSNCPTNCSCTTFEKKGITVVSCSHITSLPEDAPDGILELRVSGNDIRKLENRPYLKRVSHLNASNSNISSIDEVVFLNLKRVQTMDLRGNKLASLPLSLKQNSLSNLTVMRLDGNVWNCSCANQWMKQWLLNDSWFSSNGVVCASPKNVEGVRLVDVDFDCKEEFGFLYTVEIAVVCCVSVLLLLAAIVAAVYRDVVKVLLYTKFSVRLFDHVTEDSDVTYDVFIAYSSLDGKWVRETLLPLLEGHRPQFRTCIHEREFSPGIPVSDNIDRCIKSSRRFIMVLSQNFLQSEWCCYEFQTAHAATMRNSSKRLVLITFEDALNDVHDLEDDIKSYLKTNTYLSVKDKWFKQKLYYSMPTLKSANNLKDVLGTRV